MRLVLKDARYAILLISASNAQIDKVGLNQEQFVSANLTAIMRNMAIANSAEFKCLAAPAVQTTTIAYPANKATT